MKPPTHTCRAVSLCALAFLAGACGASDEEWPAQRSNLAPERVLDVTPIEPAAGPVQEPPERIDWSAAADCRAALQLALRQAGEGRRQADPSAPVAVLVQEAADGQAWPAPPETWIEADLPFEVRDAWAHAAAPEPCVIEIGPAFALHAERRIVRKESVRSAYESGSRNETNPDYERARERVREAERRLDSQEADVISVGDPMLDLMGVLVGGVISSLDRVSEQHELNQAQEALAATPRKTHEPAYQAYHFERTIIQARKAATVPVVLLDRRQQRAWRTSLDPREARTFEVLDGLDNRDRDYRRHRSTGISADDLERWAKAPPEMKLSSVAAALLRAPPAALAAPQREPGAGTPTYEPQTLPGSRRGVGQPGGFQSFDPSVGVWPGWQ